MSKEPPMDAEQRARELLAEELIDVADGYGRGPTTFSHEHIAELAALLRKAARALQAQPGWRGIESAPRDGRQLILLLTPSRFPQVAFSDSWWRCGFSVECKPTHWHPIEVLPAAPAPKEDA